MKKTNRFMVGALAMSMALPMAGIVALAADGSGTTPVTYDTSYSIGDPDNAADPEWAVVIPKTIVFTGANGDAGRTANTSVTLMAKPGKTLPTGNKFVKVEVASKNGFTLKDNTTGSMPYTMTYNDTATNGTLDDKIAGGTKTTIGELQDAKLKITSTATLAGEAKVLGSHEDLLTYTVSNVTK